MTDFTLYNMGCRTALDLFIAPESVDSVVTDPPYGLGFMGKAWDHGVPGVEFWQRAYDVLKPGGHLLAFSGSRTYHRMVCAIEDAGFEIRDQIMWVYGSGFPKSLDVSKAIDKVRRRDFVLAAVELGMSIPGNNLHDWTTGEHSPGDKWWVEFKQVLTLEQWGAIERAVVGQELRSGGRQFAEGASGFARGVVDITAPATQAAQQWQGWGTALKPAHEPICVARKPLIGTVAANVLHWGTGGLNIDACRVESATPVQSSAGKGAPFGDGAYPIGEGRQYQESGRWPANLIHDGSPEVLAAFPDAKGQQGDLTGHSKVCGNGIYGDMAPALDAIARIEIDKSAARFFYCAKASKKDRNEGLADFVEKQYSHDGRDTPIDNAYQRNASASANHHPTVKPTDLMQYLCRLVTPVGGTVLDLFMGSGSTGKAAIREGFKFIGCELDAEYTAIARARISAAVASK